MLAQGTRFRNLNGFFALENKKKQFRQPQKGTRMHKKRYGKNDPVQWRSPDGWSGTIDELTCRGFLFVTLCAFLWPIPLLDLWRLRRAHAPAEWVGYIGRHSAAEFVELTREARLKTRESSSDSHKKAPRCTKKDTEKMIPCSGASPVGWSGIMVEPEKRFWHTELSENTEEQKTKLHISVQMHPLFPSPLRALCALRVRNRRIRVELTCRGFLL